MSPQLLAEIRRNKRIVGTCPRCGEAFRLADATLFLLGETPPEAAIEAIRAAREQIKEQRAELARRRERITSRAQKTAEAVNLGKIVEKIVPSFASFGYAAGDCRALFEPIDYVVFSGLSNGGRVESVQFVDVKSGNARLSGGQRSIKDAVENGAVHFSITGT